MEAFLLVTVAFEGLYLDRFSQELVSPSVLAAANWSSNSVSSFFSTSLHIVYVAVPSSGM